MLKHVKLKEIQISMIKKITYRCFNMKCENEAPQTGVFKNDWIKLWWYSIISICYSIFYGVITQSVIQSQREVFEKCFEKWKAEWFWQMFLQ